MTVKLCSTCKAPVESKDNYCPKCRKELNEKYKEFRKKEKERQKNRLEVKAILSYPTPPKKQQSVNPASRKQPNPETVMDGMEGHNRSTWQGFRAYMLKNPCYFRDTFGNVTIREAFTGIKKVKISEINEHFKTLSDKNINGTWAKSHSPAD